MGEALILARKQLAGDLISKKIEDRIKKRTYTPVRDLLINLKERRRKYNKEVYGKTKA